MEVTMSIHVLENDFLTIQINELGAELTSICDQLTKVEYLWNANPDYWRRHACILFPFVGTLKNKSYTYQGQTYSALPHGFARDMTFELIQKTEHEIWFSLEASEETLKNYPFLFRLELGYRLQERTITALWRVINRDEKQMHFSIGGHPAFNCPLDPDEDQSEYFITFDTNKPIRYLHVNENGLLEKKPQELQNVLTTDHGLLPIDSRLFDYDALIIEDNQCHKVSLLDPSNLPYVTVTFDAPLFGLWSPAKKKAPFICIEPWYGRCDASDFNGSLEDRDWSNSLQSGEIFETSYTIEIA
jgi:galactose mutarotase-like enzyme